MLFTVSFTCENRKRTRRKTSARLPVRSLSAGGNHILILLALSKVEGKLSSMRHFVLKLIGVLTIILVTLIALFLWATRERPHLLPKSPFQNVPEGFKGPTGPPNMKGPTGPPPSN